MVCFKCLIEIPVNFTYPKIYKPNPHVGHKIRNRIMYYTKCSNCIQGEGEQGRGKILRMILINRVNRFSLVCDI